MSFKALTATIREPGLRLIRVIEADPDLPPAGQQKIIAGLSKLVLVETHIRRSV